MELILWRHAEAEDGIHDSERKLTPKGIKQAARMAKWLRARVPADALVLVSPAKRTQQTARALQFDFKTVKEIGITAAPEDVLLAAGWPKHEGTVIVIGHQPTVGETASLLLTGTASLWSVKKGAILWITCRSDVAPARTHLRVAISPDLI
jgi:phosphohistidine phosphatase